MKEFYSYIRTIFGVGNGCVRYKCAKRRVEKLEAVRRAAKSNMSLRRVGVDLVPGVPATLLGAPLVGTAPGRHRTKRQRNRHLLQHCSTRFD